MLLAGGWCVLFFSLSGSKLPTYVLPAFPPLALALGYFLAGSRWAVSRWTRGAVMVTGLLLLGLHYGGIPWFADFHSPMSRADEVARYCDRTPVVCFPRGCDSVAFYLGRDDLCCYRSKEIAGLMQYLQRQPRTVILFTHRHSPQALQEPLQKAGLRLAQLTPISRSWISWFQTGYCYMGVVERAEVDRAGQVPANGAHPRQCRG
jgi:hypothetical protein